MELAVLYRNTTLLKHALHSTSSINSDRNDAVAHSLNRICGDLVIYRSLGTVNDSPVQYRILAECYVSIRVNRHQHAPAVKVRDVHNEGNNTRLLDNLRWYIQVQTSTNATSTDTVFFGQTTDATTIKGILLPKFLELAARPALSRPGPMAVMAEVALSTLFLPTLFNVGTIRIRTAYSSHRVLLVMFALTRIRRTNYCPYLIICVVVADGFWG